MKSLLVAVSHAARTTDIYLVGSLRQLDRSSSRAHRVRRAMSSISSVDSFSLYLKIRFRLLRKWQRLHAWPRAKKKKAPTSRRTPI